MRRILIILAGVWLLSGCAGASHQLAYSGPQEMTGTVRAQSAAGQAVLQCAPYVRAHSPVKLFGDAWTWWDQASGKYERGPAPSTGNVMVLHNYAGPDHGHLAVVRRIVSAREIRIDHANWLNDGSIYLNNPVVDVSAANDWSQVRVFNLQTGAWGVRSYPVRGFIGQGSNQGSNRAGDGGKPLPAPVEIKPSPAPLEIQPIDALIADLTRAGPSARTDDRNAPANSAFALTAQDLAIAGD